MKRAIFDGIWALNEIGLQLFLSGTLRHCRQRIGEPDVTVATHIDNTVRIRFSSVFDENTNDSGLEPIDSSHSGS